MDRKHLIRNLVQSLKVATSTDTNTALAKALASRGLVVTDRAITSWASDKDWQRIPEPPMMAELLTIAGITDPAERNCYFDPVPPERTATHEPPPAAA